MFKEPFESWKKKPSYTFGAQWLSRAMLRRAFAEEVALIDKTLKALSAHPFETPGQEFLRIVEPFGDYALSLSVEYARFRHFMDGPFGAEDNPIHSLIGLACRVMGLSHDADEDTAPTLLAEGVLSLTGTTVRVADWEHTFDAEDEVFESVPYVEVNIAAPAHSFFFENLNPPEEEA